MDKRNSVKSDSSFCKKVSFKHLPCCFREMALAVKFLIPSIRQEYFTLGHSVIMRIYFPFVDHEELVKAIFQIRPLLHDNFYLEWDFQEIDYSKSSPNDKFLDDDDIPF